MGKAKPYTDIWTFAEGLAVSLLSSSQRHREASALAFILPLRKRKPRDVEELPQLYAVGQWQNQDVNFFLKCFY